MNAPNTFVWGAASSAYHVEGGAFEDGRRLTVWDTFSQILGAVYGGHTGEVACDHHHRYSDDVTLMQTLRFAGISSVGVMVAHPAGCHGQAQPPK